MSRIKNALISFVCIASVLFFVTGEYSHHASPPQFTGSQIEPFHKKGVRVNAKAYSQAESKRYLDRDILRSGYAPVQVTIQNNTGNTYVLSSDSVGMHHAHPNELANRAYVKGIPRSVALKVAGFFFWPFLIPSAIDTIVTLKTHFSMKRDFYAKSIKDEGEFVVPYSTVHRILFVPHQHLQEGFDLHLQSLNSHSYTSFPVEIYS